MFFGTFGFVFPHQTQNEVADMLGFGFCLLCFFSGAFNLIAEALKSNSLPNWPYVDKSHPALNLTLLTSHELVTLTEATR